MAGLSHSMGVQGGLKEMVKLLSSLTYTWKHSCALIFLCTPSRDIYFQPLPSHRSDMQKTTRNHSPFMNYLTSRQVCKPEFAQLRHLRKLSPRLASIYIILSGKLWTWQSSVCYQWNHSKDPFPHQAFSHSGICPKITALCSSVPRET